ncbi:3095_t:CDS:1 [Paraglomus brasilianum]|uniref:3095_t:CDS:1 n=1 Tax=Paraglomus brasilianum TaxID=144538 RepID=A0A9N9BKV8_9GLOM|nr:3095_t:CDS:1 [Paraglomus brasilianum]
MSSNSISQNPILRQVYSHAELCTTTKSTCPATCFINNLTPTELELFCNPPYTLTISYDILLKPTGKRRKNSNKKSLPPRPQNGWILFRRDFESRVRSQCPDVLHTLKEISKMAAESWKSQPEEVKQYFNVLSKLALHKHKVMYPEYIYNPKKFKNGENFIFKHLDKDKIAKSYNSKASLSKKAKASDLSNNAYSGVIRNESYTENNERRSNLPSPSSIIDFWSLISDLPDLLTQMSPNSIQTFPFFPQCQFSNDINNDNINASYTDVEFGHYSY